LSSSHILIIRQGKKAEQEAKGNVLILQKEQKNELGLMDVILLHSNTHTFRPFMWPSSGWREVEYKYSCYHHPEYKATYVIETYR
jgi:hypothetical protein